MNPFDLLDSLLLDWASPRVRRSIHTVLLLVAGLVSVYLAVDGDWGQFAISLIATLYAAANKANTPAIDLHPSGTVMEPDDGLSYEASGGAAYDASGDLDAQGNSIAYDAGIPSAKGEPLVEEDVTDPLWPRTGGDVSRNPSQ